MSQWAKNDSTCRTACHMAFILAKSGHIIYPNQYRGAYELMSVVTTSLYVRTYGVPVRITSGAASGAVWTSAGGVLASVFSPLAARRGLRSLQAWLGAAGQRLGATSILPATATTADVGDLWRGTIAA